ncbi:MAG: type II toxin-antitoxin system RelE/ParE family toxin [Proteobacteria bacterium]|nr:type II toxin-antitoxin system RelE/ParE family toxin [Pseudomonadota bacterium]
MQIIWEQDAISDLIELREYIAQFNPKAAEKLGGKIIESANLLPKNPLLGKVGKLHETRELVIPDSSYTLIYYTESKSISILRIFHQSRKWGKFGDKHKSKQT